MADRTNVGAEEDDDDFLYGADRPRTAITPSLENSKREENDDSLDAILYGKKPDNDVTPVKDDLSNEPVNTDIFK